MAEERVTQGGTQRYWRATSESAAFAIPDTLQSLLAARLDRLEDATRSVLQLASVIGRTFYYRLLQTVDDSGAEVDKHVDTLLKMEMIREAARVPEVEYVFRNPMTQEAVYQTILLKRRREFHRRVGEAMEALYPERLEAHFGLLAYHFALAGEHAKAIAYYRRASQQAIALFAYDDAIQNLQAALDLIKALAPTAMHLTLLEELADVYRMLRDGGRAIANFQMALDLQEGIADTDQETRVRLHRKIVQVVTELKWTVSLEFLQQANASRLASRARLEESLDHLSDKPHPETVHVLVVLSTDAWRIQEPPDWDAAQQFAEAAVAMAEQLDDLVTLAQALGALANVLDGRSLLQAHLQIAERQLAICREPHFDDVRELLEAIRRVGAAHVYIGAYEQALPYLIEAENLAVRAQIIDQQTNAIGLQSQCWFRLDRWDELLAGEEKWRALERRYPRERVGETCFYVGLCASAYAWRGESERAEIYRREAYEYMLSMSGSSQGWQRNQFYCRSLPLWAAGELTLVREHLETALKTSGQPIKRGTMPHDHDVYALLTDCAARQRDMAALQQYMPQAKELAERDGHKLYLAVVQRSAGVASCLVGSYDQAEMQFRTALESFEELGTRWQFARTLAELGELAQARSNFETARGYFSQSLAVFDEMQARPDAARIRAQLETLG
jgi:tetratricopeptide (TPR) repeat protein